MISAIPILKALVVLTAMTSLVALPQKKQHAAEASERFVLVRLADRKPVANQHLVIFMGATVKEARKHPIRLEVDTDSDGIIAPKIGPKIRWFQVWHKEGESCSGGTPARDVFHSSVLFDEGALVSDTCGSGLERLQPYIILRPMVNVPLRSPIR
jgi:hypothetical protein